MNLPNDISSCHEIILAQQELILQLLPVVDRVKELEARIKEQESRLNQNSQNSHRPPSSDGLKKRAALPSKKNKKQGGQKGHTGKTLEMVASADHIEVHAPQRCSCGCDLSGLSKQVVERRQVFDLPAPKLEVTEHQLQSCLCPQCHTLQVGQYPGEVPARVQYGPRVRSLVVLLNNGYKLPFSKIRQFFSDVFGYQLNESTQCTVNRKCYEELAASEAFIQQQLLSSPVNHFDETGLRVATKLHWLHNCSNARYTYLFVHPKRGKKALNDTPSLIPDYQGWAVHDCWASYFKYEQCRHAICGAHLLRELQALIENGSTWAGRMHDLLLYAYDKSNQGTATVPDPELIRRQYERICRIAQEEEPPPIRRHEKKRAKKTKGRNLLERLTQYQDSVLAFARYPEVPFTNNQAERDIRPTKIKQKMAGCFRTLDGAQVYARIQGFISTSRKHQLNVFNELVATFGGTNSIIAPIGC